MVDGINPNAAGVAGVKASLFSFAGLKEAAMLLSETVERYFAKNVQTQPTGQPKEKNLTCLEAGMSSPAPVTKQP
ncbi:MAG: hypothetical protein NTZ10_01160 [Candidatus Saganbacteria bacterium]|nr:hypothetical protein [Candidatus Saganbacteria bacterium]